MKAIIYTRFSPQPNGAESKSCEVQEAYCEEVATKEGWEIGGTFEDRERSGKDQDRPGMWAAIDQLGKDDVLLVYNLDRLARNLYLMEGIRHTVSAKGARIVAVVGDVGGDTPEAVMMRQILGAVAEYERKIIARRTKQAMIHLQRNGKSVSRHPPYGYRREGDRLVEVDTEQATIRYIKRLHDDNYDASQITTALNGSEFRKRSGISWRRRDVERIISNLKVEKDD